MTDPAARTGRRDWPSAQEAAADTRALPGTPAMPALPAILLVALCYALTGLAALLLAIPPGYASPFYPSAGIALAAALALGWRALPGVALGSLAVNLVTGAQHAPPSLATVGVPVVIAVGATLQALLGAQLVQRFVRQPLTLGEPRDIVLFNALGAGVACVLSAGVGTLALVHAGVVRPNDLMVTALTWWAGDTLGVLIAAPIALTLIGRPRAEWAPRRLTVGLTLSLATAFIAGGIVQVMRWDAERAHNAFEREADRVGSGFRARLQEPLHALEALRGVFIASKDVTQAEVQMATQAWLQPGHLLAMGWSEQMPRSQVPSFEARVRAQGQPQYRVYDRTDAEAGPDAGADAAPERPVVAIRYIEPLPSNLAALGVNSMSHAVARAAIEQAGRTGQPAATAGFRLAQQPAGQDLTGVVVYAPIYRRDEAPATPQQRVQSLRGVVFVSLHPDGLLTDLMADLLTQTAPGLQVCVVDTDVRAARRRIAGAAGCDDAPAQPPARGVTVPQRRTVAFGGRQWELRIQSRASGVVQAGASNAWLFALVGLLSASMLGALLLTVTGRTRRIEAAVRTRTAALQAEVHERVQAQAALQESEQRFRNILDNVPIGVVYTDLHGNIIKANPRFCELTGHSEPQLLAMTVSQYTHPDDIAEDTRLSSRLLRGEVPMYRREKRCIGRDGRTVWVQSTVSLLRDALGRPRHIVGAMEDIGERRRLQEAESARERAEASSRAKNEFLSRMSHELRTPLNAVLGFAQLLDLDRHQPLAPAHRPWVGQIQQAGWHLLEMINDVLDLSRIEAGNLRLQNEPLDVMKLVQEVLPMLRSDAQARGITITTRVEGEAIAALGDATRVRQILINLLSNAVKYNVDGGSVVLGIGAQGRDAVFVSVTDSGIGMTVQQHGELFRPFNRLGQERSTRQGTGIGLVISKGLAESMGGTLRAEPAEGRGTRFVLSLPATGAGDRLQRGAGAPVPLPQLYGERLVHYVEDNETNVEVMRGVLAQRPQVRMVVSVNGADARAALLASRPDLVLLDMHLPDTTGLALLRHLKAQPATASIPVVAVSADALPEHVEAVLAAGAAGYLTKPIEVAHLLAVLDEHFGVDAERDLLDKPIS